MTERELFKEAVMQYMVDDTRVMRVSKRRKNRHVARKVLFAAACLVVALSVTVFAIPSARAAVSDWINGWFTARDYFGQEKSERTEEPSIEAITSKANSAGITISNVGAGYEAYANVFDMTLDEIAYDGETIFLSGTMSGATARPFVQPYTGGDTFLYAKNDGSLGGDPNWPYYFFECESVVTFRTKDGGTYIGNIVPTITKEMDPILSASAAADIEPVFQGDKLITTNAVADQLWDEYLAKHDVRFSVELIKTHIDMQPLSGMVQGDLSLRLFYGNVEGADSTQALSADFGSITVDANAYQAETQTTQAQTGASVQLGGVHPITVQEWQPEAERTSEDCPIYYYTHELDFTGAAYSLKEISFTPTDTKIVLHVTLPAAWTRQERRGGGFGFQFLIDGKAIDENAAQLFSVSGPEGMDYETSDYLEFDYVFFESTLSPSQWTAMKSLTIIPTTWYWWEMSLSDDNKSYQAYSLKDDAVVTTYANVTSTMYDELREEMPQYALTINLDDYR